MRLPDYIIDGFKSGVVDEDGQTTHRKIVNCLVALRYFDLAQDYLEPLSRADLDTKFAWEERFR